MAALVVSVVPASWTKGRGDRIGIFPGAATTTVFAANTPFWIGYGFAADPDSSGLSDDTRFELDVDGRPASMNADTRSEAGRQIRTTHVATFAEGLPPGWHDFAGRWYEAGSLVLSTRTAIQFLEA